jgi:hypothetical protein
MQCRGKKEENWKKKNCHLPIFGMVGVGEDVSRGSAVLTRKKSAKKCTKINKSVWSVQTRFSDGKRTESGCHYQKDGNLPADTILFQTAPYEN